MRDSSSTEIVRPLPGQTSFLNDAPLAKRSAKSSGDSLSWPKKRIHSVRIQDLRPNPFRRLDEYPIDRKKVEALKESIRSTGFWSNIVGRPRDDGTVEIAFGHHRWIALKEEAGDGEEVQIIVRDLSNEQMIRMMARENMEEWGSLAWVELESVRATIDAYAKGEIELPPIPKDTPKSNVRDVTRNGVSRPFTKSSVAQFLGWTRKNHEDGLQPNTACEIAFKAMDLLDKELLKESDLKGITRRQMGELAEKQWSIYLSEKRQAKHHRENAESARKMAEEAKTDTERDRFETQAKVFQEQAEGHERSATEKAKTFGREASNMLREGSTGIRGLAKVADAYRAPAPPPKVISVDEYSRKFIDILERLASGGEKEKISNGVEFLLQNKQDLSVDTSENVHQAFRALIVRLEKLASAFRVS